MFTYDADDAEECGELQAMRREAAREWAHEAAIAEAEAAEEAAAWAAWAATVGGVAARLATVWTVPTVGRADLLAEDDILF